MTSRSPLFPPRRPAASPGSGARDSAASQATGLATASPPAGAPLAGPPGRDATLTQPACPRHTPATGAPRRGECHYCGNSLPKGRTVTFCPCCGEDVTVRHCPACSAEVDVGWRFCVCCGRGVAAE